jgi:low affinity Fe/Cu permease
MKIGDAFSGISRKASNIAGSWQAFIAATSIVMIWVIGGFFFGFLDPVYQLVINTFTTCVTFIMVFLIQGASNRDVRALHIKLDDLLCSIQKANEQLIDIEDATDEQIAEARAQIGANKDSSPA